MNQANRGMNLEKTVKELFKRYEQEGIFCLKIEVEKAQGRYIAKSPFDFIVFYNKQIYAFDTKHCQKGRMAMQNFKLHQIKALSDVRDQGGDAFFLVYFAEQKKLNKIPVSEIISMIKNNVKTVEYSSERDTGIDIIGLYK